MQVDPKTMTERYLIVNLDLKDPFTEMQDEFEARKRTLVLAERGMNVELFREFFDEHGDFLRYERLI